MRNAWVLAALCAVAAMYLVGRLDYTFEVPTKYATIEAAIAAAEDGDQVMVAPGSYTANIQWVGKDLTIMGSGCDTTTVTLTNFFTGRHKDESGNLTRPVSVRLASMTITGSRLLLSDTTTVQDAVVTRSKVEMTGVVRLYNVLLHHNDVYVHGAQESRGGRESAVIMQNVTLWDNSQFFLEGRNDVNVQASVLQEWTARISGMTNDRDRTTFRVSGSYTANPLYSEVSDWVPRFRDTRVGDYTICVASPIGQIGAQFGR